MASKTVHRVLLEAALLSLALAWSLVFAHPLLDQASEDWRFDVTPPVNGTSNLVFDTVANFLQQWGNTRYRNGESACTWDAYTELFPIKVITLSLPLSP
jgi:hypothetical protein